MFSYFTGAAKKAVSRRGKEPHKFRFARAPTRTDPRPPSKSNNNPPDLGPHPGPSTLRRPVRADPRVAPVSPPTQDRRVHRGRLGTPGKGQGGMRDPGACPIPNERREKAHS